VVSAPSSQRILLNDFVAQWHDVGADALAALERVGESGWLILGREVKAFEAELSTFWGIPHVVSCANGLDAIEIALRALGIAPGDKVLTTPLSAFATSLAIVRAGGVPVFVDVDASGLLDLKRAAEAIQTDPAIKFCVPVHLFGHALDAEQLARLALLPVQVIEDCAQACGAASRGTPVGATGSAAATSFYPTKNLGAMGDGGALLTRDPGVAAEAASLRDYGQTAKYVHARLGMNSRLDELQAAILRSALLPRLPAFTERRIAIAAAYRRSIHNAALQLPPVPDGSTSVWHLFPVLVAGSREAFMSQLERAGVGSGIHYPTLIPDQPALSGARFECRDALTQARRFATTEVSLPIHPYLSDEQVERVVTACNAYKP
jgi:dTDP-3-amino-3,4,6-trideoxy-alpha-D-glucose transaminase